MAINERIWTEERKARIAFAEELHRATMPVCGEQTKDETTETRRTRRTENDNDGMESMNIEEKTRSDFSKAPGRSTSEHRTSNIE